MNKKPSEASRKDIRDRNKGHHDHVHDGRNLDRNSQRDKRTSDSHRSSPPTKHPEKTGGNKDVNKRTNQNYSSAYERTIHKPSSDHKISANSERKEMDRQNERDRRTSDRRTESSRGVFKRPRTKSPPTPIQQNHVHGHPNEKSPERKFERKQVKKEVPTPASDGGFGNSGFGNSGFGTGGFANSGFSNSGFTNSGFSKSNFDRSGFNKNRNSGITGSQWRDNQGKPRIMPPEGEQQHGSQSAGGLKMIIVNELSAESIKRDDNPLKGARPARRQNMRSGGFVGQRGGGRENTFGAGQRAPIAGFGTRDGSNFGRSTLERTDPNKKEGGRFSSRRTDGDEVTNPPPDEKQPPLNPLAVPRGRNYFLHDHRDSLTNDNRLYDPRLDRGGDININPNRNTGNGRFMRGRGGGGSRGGAPMGWRSFDNDRQEESGAFSRRGLFQGQRGRFTHVGGFAGADPTDRSSWRSNKADEDIVWKHDKYMEISKEQVDTKLKLLDEIGGEQSGDGRQAGFESYGQVEGRQRYQDDDDLEYETEETMVVYD